MIVEKAWGSDLELSAISDAYEISIHVYIKSNKPELVFQDDSQVPKSIIKL